MKITSFVISIPPLFHRLEQSVYPSFNQSKLINPKLFEGIDGRKNPYPDWWKNKKSGGCLSDGFYEPGVWGLVQSYINLFDKIIEKKIEGPILILEDDSIIIDPQNFDLDITNFLTNLPLDWRVGYISGYEIKNDKNLITNTINDYVVKSNIIYQTNAIFYNGYKVCESLKQSILNFPENEPIDILYMHCFNTLKYPTYRSSKKLVYQESFYSSALEKPEHKSDIKYNWQY